MFAATYSYTPAQALTQYLHDVLCQGNTHAAKQAAVKATRMCVSTQPNKLRLGHAHHMV